MPINLVWLAPFIVLLAAIAVMPLINKQWWESNFTYVSLSLAFIIIVRYLFLPSGGTALLHVIVEYLSFICLVGSLFVVSGGILINVKGEATPAVNTVFLFVAAVLSNFLGTTGASMVMIRPWMRMNKYRLTSYHIIFFIFIVSNIGGALTPIGDPPLFLGYLMGIPFFWVLKNLWPIWLLAISILLTIFYICDLDNFRRAPVAVQNEKTESEQWRFLGWQNIVFLGMIIGAVFINKPRFLREFIMITAAAMSYVSTPKQIHLGNNFNFEPIKEVAILFLGIFVTMIPALEWLRMHAAEIGISSAGQFYWGSGALSSVLDNAPTYLNFLSGATGLLASGSMLSDNSAVAVLVHSYPNYIRAISVGCVFFGAMTYIGNGPNFLVKSIAGHAKVKMPSFFGYVFRFGLPILAPVFLIVWYCFFRG